MPMSDRPLLDRARDALASRWVPLVASVTAVALCSPGLFSGLIVDDYLHRAALLGAPGYPGLKRAPGDAYAFVRGGRDEVQREVGRGLLPWWSSPDLKLAFWRPLSGWLHWLDWRLWPQSPVLMHAHSLAWLAIAVYAVGMLYRRLMSPAWSAGLAAILFAVDDARAAAGIWIADRNAVTGLALGALALLAYQRGRSHGGRTARWLAPLLLGLALLANEGSIAIAGYLAAHAVFLEAGPWRRRAAGLAPCAVVVAAWLVAYKLGGYGVHDSTMYLDPIGEPARFLRAAAKNFPLLIWGQWMTPPPELSWMMSIGGERLFVAVAAAFGVGLAWMLWPLLRRDAVARFFAAGMLLAIVPVCATAPQDRLLQIVGIGGTGLIAQFLAGVAGRAAWLPRGLGLAAARTAAVVLVVVHVLIAPVKLALSAPEYRNLGRTMERIAATLPGDEASRRQQWIVVHTPSAFFTLFTPVVRSMQGESSPERLLVLSAGLRGAEIERPDARTLRVRMPGAFLPRPGTPSPERSAGAIEFDPNYACQLLDLLFQRDDAAVSPGQRVSLGGVEVVITRRTPDGRPAEVEFHFDRPLEADAYRWLVWHDRGYTSFSPPAVGETVTLPPATLTRRRRPE